MKDPFPATMPADAMEFVTLGVSNDAITHALQIHCPTGQAFWLARQQHTQNLDVLLTAAKP